MVCRRLLGVGWVVIALVQVPAGAQITLTNWTNQAGLAATHVPNAAGIPGTQDYQVGGAAVGDFNGDGCMDIFWTGGGGTADKLFINNCDGTGTFTDQAAAWGVNALHTGNGVAVGDYNRDGRADMYVTSFGLPGSGGAAPGSHRLYRNDGGQFTEVAAAAGVNFSCPAATGNAAGYGACFGDYDLDGWLDLCVTSWWGGEAGNRLYHNNGDGSFTDVTESALGAGVHAAWGFQPAFVDMDGDRYPELLIAADFETSRYFLNNRNGTFTDITAISGTGLDDNGMGQAVADFNRDAKLDWYVTSIHTVSPQKGDNIGNMLYLQLAANSFFEISDIAGVNDGGWGWGTIGVDLDQDTWPDLVEVNGRPAGEWLNEREYLWRNNGNAIFTEIAVASGFNLVVEGRGLAYLDADEDGDLDFFVTVNAGPLSYFRNDTSGGHWLRIRLQTANNPLLAPDGFGTRVEVQVGGVTQVNYMSGSPSYLATSETAVHFGLGGATNVNQLRVKWATGHVTVLNDVAADQQLLITAPAPGDLDADGVVGINDFLALLQAWGPCPGGGQPCLPDLNGDGVVGISDFLTLLQNWG
jgi:hypothetical protein